MAYNITHYHYFSCSLYFILCKLKATDKNSRLVIQSINVKLLNYKTKGFNNLWLCDMIHQMQQFSLINDIYAFITKELQGSRPPYNVVWSYNQCLRNELSSTYLKFEKIEEMLIKLSSIQAIQLIKFHYEVRLTLQCLHYCQLDSSSLLSYFIKRFW